MKQAYVRLRNKMQEKIIDTNTRPRPAGTPSSLEGDLLSAEILERIEQEKILPKFDGNEVYFCGYMEHFLMNVGKSGNCPTAVQMNNYLKHPDKSDQQLKDLILASKRQWKTEKGFEDLVKNHKKIHENTASAASENGQLPPEL